MRVGLIIYGSLETVSGGYIYDRILVEHLRRQGDQVDVISLPWHSYTRHLAHNLSSTLVRRLRRASLDVLLQDELNHPSLFWLNRRLRPRVRYPILSIVHHMRCSEARPAWQNSLYRYVERRYLASVDGFIFNSQTTRAAVEGVLGTPKPATVAYPGGDRLGLDVTPAHITRRARESGPLRILFFANLIPRKGLHTLLDALSRLPGDSWRLEVLGDLDVDPAYVHAIRRTVRRQITATGVAEQVTLSGSLPDPQLPARLLGSHVLCVPSSYEGFGIVYLEGMAAGLPAIASDAGAAREIITHGRDGFLVPTSDAASLARHIRCLIDDRQRLARMSLAARQHYLDHPTWAQSAHRIRHFLETWTN